MRKKRIISWILCVIYVVATLGPVYSSLSCRCARLHGHQHPFGTLCASACKGHGGHHGHDEACLCAVEDRTADACVVSEPCCSHHHSTESALYTFSDQERMARTVAPILISVPDRLVPVVVADFVAAAVLERTSVGALLSGEPSIIGLRAPPVLG